MVKKHKLVTRQKVLSSSFPTEKLRIYLIFNYKIFTKVHRENQQFYVLPQDLFIHLLLTVPFITEYNCLDLYKISRFV